MTPEKLDKLKEAVLEALEYIKDARAQKDYVNALKALAKATNSPLAELPYHSKSYLFYFDYAQNVQCPQFSSEQPGETYYYSPLNINIFGIIDENYKKETLFAYCYHKRQGKKVATTLFQCWTTI